MPDEGHANDGTFPSAQEDRHHAGLDPETAQTSSPAYKLGYADLDFMMRDELRPARLQLEYLKPEIMQRDRGVTSTVVVFGSARICDATQAAAKVDEAQRAVEADPKDAAAAQRLKTAQGPCRQAPVLRRGAQTVATHLCSFWRLRSSRAPMGCHAPDAEWWW